MPQTSRSIYSTPTIAVHNFKAVDCSGAFSLLPPSIWDNQHSIEPPVLVRRTFSALYPLLYTVSVLYWGGRNGVPRVDVEDHLFYAAVAAGMFKE